MYIDMQVGNYVLAILEIDTKRCRLRDVSAVCVCVCVCMRMYTYIYMYTHIKT